MDQNDRVDIALDSYTGHRLDSFDFATFAGNLKRRSWIAERSTTIASRFNKSFDLEMLTNKETFFRARAPLR
jgi:hypothetical protein